MLLGEVEKFEMSAFSEPVIEQIAGEPIDRCEWRIVTSRIVYSSVEYLWI
jgi:hypothetical protein